MFNVHFIEIRSLLPHLHLRMFTSTSIYILYKVELTYYSDFFYYCTLTQVLEAIRWLGKDMVIFFSNLLYQGLDLLVLSQGLDLIY
jgi:hypothetical protein